MQDKQHRFDIFEEGDEIPWFSGYATVVSRTVTDEIPDDVPDWAHPRDFSPPNVEDGTDYVIIRLEQDGRDDIKPIPATRLAREVQVSFSEHGLPSVSADAFALGVGTGKAPSIRAQTPAVGMSDVGDADDAESLAAFLRIHKDFEPLYAVLGDVDSVEDMEELADAFDRAAATYRIGERIEPKDFD